MVRLAITPGNTDDRAPVPDMLKDISCKLVGDKDYPFQKVVQYFVWAGNSSDYKD